MRGDRTRQERKGGGGEKRKEDRQTDRVMFGWWQKVFAQTSLSVNCFLFLHFYGTCKSPAEQALSIQISPANLSDNESIGLKTLTRFAYISLLLPLAELIVNFVSLKSRFICQ